MHDAWARIGLRAYGAAQVLLALAVVPGIATAFVASADAGLGQAALRLAAGAAAVGCLAIAAAGLLRRGGRPEGTSRWARLQFLAVAALALDALAYGELPGALLGLIAAGVGAWAVEAWTSHRPGGRRAGAAAALVAGLAYLLALRNGLLAGLPLPSSFGGAWAGAVMAPGFLAAGLAAAAFAARLLARTTLRRLGVAVAAVTLLAAGVIVVRRVLDALGTSPWDQIAGTSGFAAAQAVTAAMALVAVLLAAACAIGWGATVMVRELPEIFARLGHGVSENEPGEVCVACGWIPIQDARYCMMCGNRLWTATHQPPASP